MRNRLSGVVVLAVVAVIGAGCNATSPLAEPTSGEQSAGDQSGGEPTPSTSIDRELSEEELMLADKVAEEGSVKVIVRVTAEDETGIAEQVDRLTTGLAEYGVTELNEGTDWFSTEVSAEALNFLLASPDVEHVYENGTLTTN